MKIAIPTNGGVLAGHFGHCRSFTMFDGAGVKVEEVEAPPHQPGFLPGWLKERGVEVVVAGGMGERAKGLLEGLGVKVVLGAAEEAVESVARAYVAGTLETKPAVCQHHHGH